MTLPTSYGFRKCKACKSKFEATNHGQLRCQSCIDGKPPGAPMCKCGCKAPVRWSRHRGGWNDFVHGHHVVLNNPGFKPGLIPWSTGNKTRYKHKCLLCGKRFANKLKEASFCTHACSSTFYAGENHPKWKGGRTKYKHGRENGKSYRVHRKIMAELLGRALKRTESVHHIDENGLNNDPENLHLFHCEACHQFHHNHKNALRYFYPVAHSTI